MIKKKKSALVRAGPREENPQRGTRYNSTLVSQLS